MTNSVDLDEVVHSEPPHEDLRCLQVSAFFVSGTQRATALFFNML